MNVMQMLKKSFGENSKLLGIPKIKESIKKTEEEIKGLKQFKCPFDGSTDIEDSYLSKYK